MSQTSYRTALPRFICPLVADINSLIFSLPLPDFQNFSLSRALTPPEHASNFKTLFINLFRVLLVEPRLCSRSLLTNEDVIPI